MTITLNEADAVAWLVEQQRKADAGEDYDISIPDTWNPVWDDDDNAVATLVDWAVNSGGDDLPPVITMPDDVTVFFLYAGDADGGTYVFLLRTHGLTLASTFEAFRKIGDLEKRGVDRAISILNEAVLWGNGLLADLETYVEKRTAS